LRAVFALAVGLAALAGNATAAPALTPCTTKQLSLSLQAHTSKQGLVVEAGFDHFKGAACRLTLGYTLTIQTGNATSTRVRAISGNPSTIKRPRTLASKQRVTYRWLWANWCGTRRRYVLNALDSARGGLIIKALPPACTAGGKRSLLRPLT
jgi:hypothetical protein